jgi:hypothetical protein
MYQVILETGAGRGVFTLANVAGHSTIDHDVATELILDYARLATGHPLPNALSEH